MKKRDWLFEVPSRRESEPILRSDQILQLKLSELTKGDIAIKIHSEILKCEIWLCPSDSIGSQIRRDDPETAIYTVDELRELIRLRPTLEELRYIQNVKSVFSNSRLIEGVRI